RIDGDTDVEAPGQLEDGFNRFFRQIEVDHYERRALEQRLVLFEIRPVDVAQHAKVADGDVQIAARTQQGDEIAGGFAGHAANVAHVRARVAGGFEDTRA